MAEEHHKTQEAISRAAINAQAERMLADYGNAVLRTAYSLSLSEGKTEAEWKSILTGENGRTEPGE